MAGYPGLGLPLRHYPQEFKDFYPMGTHSNCLGSWSQLLPVREVAMMIIMNSLTDKHDWHKKVFDDEIVSKWKKEALDYPDESLWDQATGGKRPKRYAEDNEDNASSWAPPRLKGIMSSKAFDYCIKELRDKAKYYEATGIIPVLDSTASVAKSDTLVSKDLQDSFRLAFETLKAAQENAPDWHPGSNEMVQDLVHPSMYPLVYGRSRVFKDEVVGVYDAIDKWARKGEVIEKDTTSDDQNARRRGIGSEVPSSFWSDTYQWLPANAAFQDDGTIKFTSYINNLHPNRYPEIYSTIEKLVQVALPLWNQCLAESTTYDEKRGAGRIRSRFSKPAYYDDEHAQNWNPSDAAEMADVEINWDEVDSQYRDENSWRDPAEDEADRKWRALREPVQLEPDNYQALSYAPFMTLAEKFRKSGLQIIVKMASIELTPERPEFPTGGWHVEGQMNEQICATALYYLDSENITPSSLSFRMQTSPDMQDEYDQVGQDSYSWLERVYGTFLGLGSVACLQNYGSVDTTQGRLLAFPNVFQHKVSSFRLADPTKPGYRRFIALWLVDPHKRIISTANVPPQQQDWWTESFLGRSTESRQAALTKLPAELVQVLLEKGYLDDDEKETNDSRRGRLPVELMDMVRSYFNASIMSNEEAKKHRAKLIEVRTTFHDNADDAWQQHTYNFCEH